jgi:hypothetical protein
MINKIFHKYSDGETKRMTYTRRMRGLDITHYLLIDITICNRLYSKFRLASWGELQIYFISPQYLCMHLWDMGHPTFTYL